MERLNERERFIIQLRFFEGKTQMEVAEQIQISQAQVSRLEKKCIENNETISVGLKAVILSSNKISEKTA